MGEGAHVELLWLLNMPSIEGPCLTPVKQREEHNCVVHFSLVDKQISLCCNIQERSLPIAWLAFWIRTVISLSNTSSLEMVLPKYLKASTFCNWVPSMVMYVGCETLIGAGWGRTSVFPKLIVRPNSSVATDLSTITYRWFSSWFIRAQLSANSASVNSFLNVIFAARRRWLNNEPSGRYRT